MEISILIVLVFGIFNLAGGVIGYRKAQSRASLIAGSAAGTILLFAAFQMNRGILAGSYLSLAVALLLGLRFFGTWMKKRRLMPDLLMVILSLATLISVGLRVFGR